METFKLDDQDKAIDHRPDSSPEKGGASKLVDESCALSSAALNLAQKSASFSNMKTNSHCDARQPNSVQTLPGNASCGVSAFSVQENGSAPREDVNGCENVGSDTKNHQQVEPTKQNPVAPQCASSNPAPIDTAYMGQPAAPATLPISGMPTIAQLDKELKQPIANENQTQLPPLVNFVPNIQQQQSSDEQNLAQPSDLLDESQKMPPISSILRHTAAFQNQRENLAAAAPAMELPAYNKQPTVAQMLEAASHAASKVDMTQVQNSNRNLYTGGAGEDFHFDMMNIRKNVPFDSSQCYHCKMPGDLTVMCSDCEHPYHLRCVGLTKTPHDDLWFCQDCQQVRRENLLRKLKEENRRKAEERQKKKDEETRMKEEARKLREDKMNQRREEKLQAKQKVMELKIERETIRQAQIVARKVAMEETALKKHKALEDAKAAAIAQGLDPDSLLKNDGSLKRSVQTTLSMALENGVTSNNQGFNDPTLLQALKSQRNLESKKKTIKKPPILSEAELEKQERQKLIKSQMQLFQRLYPELVEKNSIRYPIEDSLILMLPELHGQVYPEKPIPKRISTSNEEFERLLYIWEFCNNFDEFLGTPKFRIEDLRLALRWGSSPPDEEENELGYNTQQAIDNFREEQETLIAAGYSNWTEQMTDKQLGELGFNMINVLHLALLGCFMQDMFQEEGEGEQTKTTQPSFSVGENQTVILNAINKLISEKEKEQIWPEIVRLMLVMRHDVEDYGDFEETMNVVLHKLEGLEPASFMSTFTYNEKLTLLTVLIDTVHDLNFFRQFLNGRQETKSTFNKEKQEVYSAIKLLEAEQAEILKEMNEPAFIEKQEDLTKELEGLKHQLAMSSSSRSETKSIRTRIHEIQSEQEEAYYRKQKIEEKIARNQTKVQRLADKAYQTSIKTTVLGRDAQRQEYWHFKDDPSRIYIRREESIPIRNMNGKSNSASVAYSASGDSPNPNEIPEEAEQHEIRISWFYYDTDIEVDTLLNTCLNPKGIRERALQATMRSVRDRLKLKKGPIPVKEKPESLPELIDRATSELQAEADEEKLPQPQLSEVNGHVDADFPEPAPVEADVQMEEKKEVAEDKKSVESDQAKEEEEKEVQPEGDVEMIQSDDVQQVEQHVDQHIMFKTDKWDLSFQNAVWFGKKVPPKRRGGGRLGRNFLGNGTGNENENFSGPDLVSIPHAKKLLLNTETFYTDSSTQFSREWTKVETRDEWKEEVAAAEGCKGLSDLLTRLDDGMSLPNMLAKDGPQRGGSQYFRLMHFKFWPSQDLRKAWRDYLGEPLKSSEEQSELIAPKMFAGYPKDGNQNSLFILLKVIERITEQFVMREVEKQEKKERQAALQAVGGSAKVQEVKIPASRRVQPTPQPQVSRDQRKQASFAKYFESSIEDMDYGEEEESEQEEEESAAEEEVKQVQVPVSSNSSEVSSPRQAVQESDQEAGSEEECSESREWDEYCMICEDGGNVICCDKCNHVAHVSCLSLRKMPDDWLCTDCMSRPRSNNRGRGDPPSVKKEKNGNGKPIKKLLPHQPAKVAQREVKQPVIVAPSRSTRQKKKLDDYDPGLTSRSQRAQRRNYYS